MQLNYKIEGEGYPILLIHGLFGSLSNLAQLSRTLAEKFQVISVDLRNHGQSPKSDRHDYGAMTEDIDNLCEALYIDQCHIVGHSMGGKVAMSFAQRYPNRVDKVVVLDIAPIAYSKGRHDNVFAGLNHVTAYLNTITSRNEAESYLAIHVKDPGVRQFLLKSLKRADKGFEWQFNVASLWRNYQHIMGWQPEPAYEGPVLFVKGENSEYILPEYRDAIMRQFPHAKAHMVANTGHWLHAEKPDAVSRIVNRFLMAQN
uniref:alpha/beta fold hydrolase n=1 Tax=Thaumasiovibrio occultus TaxID=1891184 RepID=UPI000B359BBB|nr:alpha/beta fold hydrolase [Thaumasiovibrio occultus]